MRIAHEAIAHIERECRSLHYQEESWRAAEAAVVREKLRKRWWLWLMGSDSVDRLSDEAVLRKSREHQGMDRPDLVLARRRWRLKTDIQVLQNLIARSADGQIDDESYALIEAHLRNIWAGE